MRSGLCLGYTLLLLLPAIAPRAEPEVLGWLESVYLQPSGVRLRAKLDTGAKTSSIHVTDLTTYEVDDALWVSFSIPYKESKHDTEFQYVTFEKPVIRETRIKEHIGDSTERYVVEIEFCLNGNLYLSPFTLADRANFNYKILLGRTTLKNRVLVDPARSFTATKRSCSKN